MFYPTVASICKFFTTLLNKMQVAAFDRAAMISYPSLNPARLDPTELPVPPSYSESRSH